MTQCSELVVAIKRQQKIHGKNGINCNIRRTHLPSSTLLRQPSEAQIWFENCSREIENALEFESCGGRGMVFVLADFNWKSYIELSRKNPQWLLTMEDHQELIIVGMLILAFPEVTWLLNTCAPEGEIPYFHRINYKWFRIGENLPVWNERDSLPAAGCPAIFDPTSLRAWIRAGTGTQSKSFLSAGNAIVMEEEYNYAYLASLAAYRQDLRTFTITSAKTAAALSEMGKQEYFDPLKVSMEDVYLSYTDSRIKYNDLADLQTRDEIWRLGEKAKHRIFLTIGPGNDPEERRKWKKNLFYLKTKKKKFHVELKPIAGLNRLIKVMNLHDDECPPRFFGSNVVRRKEATDEHAVDGRIGFLCNHLLRRAGRMLDNAKSVQEAVCAAVLAIDAQKLLANSAPTLNLEAIALKHEAEIVAESMFIGVSQDLDVRGRLREISQECRIIGRLFSSRTRSRSVLNARLTIADRLAKRLSDQNQYDEAESCRAEARILRANFLARSSFSGLLTWPFRWYIAQCMKSLPRFFLAVVGWIVFFTIMIVYQNHYQTDMLKNLLNAAESAVYVFFTMNNINGVYPNNVPQLPPILYTTLCIVSLIHIGLLISHIYTMASRR